MFASSDGIWSMFFAVMNREEYVGSLRNACFTTPTRKGIKRYYYFSVNRDFSDPLWRDGTIYLLPKESFHTGGTKEEWICETEVRPLAKIPVAPNDFPFLNEVKWHKESDSIIKTLINVLVFNRKNSR